MRSCGFEKVTVDRILRQPPVHIDGKGLRAYRPFELMAAKVSKEPKLLRFGSAANVWQLVRLEEEEIDDRLNVDLRLARFKQVMVKDWGNQTAANGFSFGP